MCQSLGFSHYQTLPNSQHGVWSLEASTQKHLAGDPYFRLWMTPSSLLTSPSYPLSDLNVLERLGAILPHKFIHSVTLYILIQDHGYGVPKPILLIKDLHTEILRKSFPSSFKHNLKRLTSTSLQYFNDEAHHAFHQYHRHNHPHTISHWTRSSENIVRLTRQAALCYRHNR